MGGFPGDLQVARQPHQDLHQSPTRHARSDQGAGTPRCDRQNRSSQGRRMSLARRLGAEGTGSLLLAAAVVGSGVMAERLAGGNAAVALLANTGATVAVLATLIALLGPISGAHFNPAVSLIQAIKKRLRWQETLAYVVVQFIGCCAGAILAHAMFELPLVQSSLHRRAGGPQLLAEFVGTFGLLLVVLGHRRGED